MDGAPVARGAMSDAWPDVEGIETRAWIASRTFFKSDA